MKNVIALVLILWVSAGFALATDKPIDNSEYTIQTGDNIELCGTVGTESTDWSSIRALFH